QPLLGVQRESAAAVAMNSTISGSESMKSATELIVERPGEFARVNYLSVHHGVRSLLLTKDHKRIGLLYLFTILVFFLIASIAADRKSTRLNSSHRTISY